MDNLNVHKEKETVMPMYDYLNIKPVWNVGYSPQFNGCEAVFSKVKYQYAKNRLNALVNKIGFNADNEINAALE